MIITSEALKERPKPFIESNVKARVFSVTELADNKLQIGLELLSGEHMGCKVYDKVGYTESTKLLWKYLKFRKSMGVPYQQGEIIVDTDELFLNKMVCINLDIFKYTNRDDEEVEMQNVNYIINWQKPKEQEKTGPCEPVAGVRYDNVFDNLPAPVRKV